MPETFAQYSEKWLKQSTAQGLNNPLVKNRWKYVFIHSNLLEDKTKISLHLSPLYGFEEDSMEEEIWEEESWIVKAKLALDAGYSPAEIADAVFGHGWFWTGKQSDMWLRWVQRFERLSSNSDKKIAAIGEIGRNRASKAYEHESKDEKNEAIYGD